MTIEQQLANSYDIHDATCKNLNTLANDSYEVTTASAKYALKLYNDASRTPQDVAWELELINHLVEQGVPVAKPVDTPNGQLHNFEVDGKIRPAVLYEWAAGQKPKAGQEIYVLLGRTAALIHQAADSFSSSLPREDYSDTLLIDEQFKRMRMSLEQVDRWQEACLLGERLKDRIASPLLDYGVCHMDLTLDNIHVDGSALSVFDFDSAGTCWRAYEPYGVLLASEERLSWWLKGYREIRVFSPADEKAVWAFAIIGDIRNTTWKLGLANSSRGEPLLALSGLAAVVDGWLQWEKLYLE